MSPAHPKQKSPWIEIPTERVQLVAPLHRADWPRRAEVVPNLMQRAAHVRASRRWPGEPIRVRAQGDHYVLVSGFSRLAVAVEAGLPTVRAIIEPEADTLPLAEIHLRPWQEKARLNPQKLARRREQAGRSGTLPVPLVVRPAERNEAPGYILLDGLYWYHVAREMGLREVPAIVQKGRKSATAARSVGRGGQQVG